MTLLLSYQVFLQTGTLKLSYIFLYLLIVIPGKAQQIPVSSTSGIAKAHYERGLSLSSQHLDGKAAEAFKQALNADSSFALARLMFAMRSKKSQSLKLIEELTTAFVFAGLTEAEQKFIKAVKARSENRNGEARQLLEELVKDYPDDIQARQELGYLYYYAFKDYVRAEETFREGYRRHPQISRFINNLGYALKAQGKLKEAEDTFKKAVDKFPEEANTHDSLGDFYFGMQRFDEAIEHYQIAVSFNEPDVNSKENLISAATSKVSLSLQNLFALQDSLVLSKVFTASALVVSSARKTHKGIAAIKQYLQAEAAKGDTNLEVKKEEMRFAENWSWEMGKYTKGSKGSNTATEGNYTIVWANTPGGWKIERLILN